MLILKLILFTLLIIAALFLISKIFVGKKILQVKSKLGVCPIQIAESGFYSLWVKGEMFTRTGVAVKNVKIIDENGNSKRSIPAIFKPKVSGFSQSSMVLKNYYLKKGTYNFTIGAGKESSLNILDNLLIKVLTKEAKNSYILKKTFPDFVIIFFIPVIPISALQIIQIIQQLNS